jgi:DNA-directed RNA polymerase subunit F
MSFLSKILKILNIYPLDGQNLRMIFYLSTHLSQKQEQRNYLLEGVFNFQDLFPDAC